VTVFVLNADRYNNFYGNWHEEKNTERSPQTKEVSDFPGLFPAEYNDYVENYANVPSNVFVFPIGNFRIVLSKNMQQKNGKSRRVQTVQYPRETNEVTLIRNRTTKAEHILVTILCDSWHTNLKHQNTHAVVLHGKTSTGEVKYYCGNVMQDFKNKTAQEYKRYELIRKCIGYVLRFFRFPFKTLIPQFKKKAPPWVACDFFETLNKFLGTTKIWKKQLSFLLTKLQQVTCLLIMFSKKRIEMHI